MPETLQHILGDDFDKCKACVQLLRKAGEEEAGECDDFHNASVIHVVHGPMAIQYCVTHEGAHTVVYTTNNHAATVDRLNTFLKEIEKRKEPEGNKSKLAFPPARRTG